MSIMKKVGITAAILATGLVGYAVYQSMQEESHDFSDDDFDDDEGVGEEADGDADDDVVYE